MIIQGLSEISWGDGGVGHDEAVEVAVLRVWLVSSASEGLQEKSFFFFCVKNLRKDFSCLTDLPPIL